VGSGAWIGKVPRVGLEPGLATCVAHLGQLGSVSPEKTASFLSFPYVCPEPVLVK
jgi:hypothetical protein